mmetsp:Transcript_9533/g.25479  ORF Transcript_9533/g.25479 Transcript_9533/m.25479 type:complete len:131 (+) Transcript_9533:4060-4452(+)
MHSASNLSLRLSRMPCGVGLVNKVMSSRPGRFLSRPERFGGGRGAMVSGATCAAAAWRPALRVACAARHPGRLWPELCCDASGRTDGFRSVIETVAIDYSLRKRQRRGNGARTADAEHLLAAFAGNYFNG